MRHNVLIKNPPASALAAGVLLARRLHKNEIREWLEFREKFLKKKLAEAGELQCEYCCRGGLAIGVSDSPGRGELAVLATIDHVIPLSKGGKEKDEKNLKVACYPCNQRKRDSEVFHARQFVQAGQGSHRKIS